MNIHSLLMVYITFFSANIFQYSKMSKIALKCVHNKKKSHQLCVVIWAILSQIYLIGQSSRFAKLATSDQLDMTYDYKSILHPGAYAMAKDSSIPTIVPHDMKADIGHAQKPSAIDIERIHLHYQYIKPVSKLYYL